MRSRGKGRRRMRRGSLRNRRKCRMEGIRMQEGNRQGLRAAAVFLWQNPGPWGWQMRGQSRSHAAGRASFEKEAVNCIFTLTI